MLTANQLPQFDVWPAFVDKGGGDFTEKARASQKAVKRLLDDLLELQTQLFMENDETKYILNSESAITKDKWYLPLSGIVNVLC